MTATPIFATGSLVKARGREWIVLPESRPAEDLYVLRPLGGTDDEVTGIYRPLEPIEPAEFALPDPARDLGSHVSGRLLREAVRLGFRSGAGPFRSLARIAVEPRPYQLVPLLMALRLDRVRLLIADDVGCGKTVEACLIARELLDRGEVERLAVLCPPHLAEQWQRALRDQFHIDATLVLAGTAARLERACAAGESLFERHPHTVISMDFIKMERRRLEFLRTCPELVIVDEAHGCAASGAGRAAQQRHALLEKVAAAPDRHVILVTATPHSGNEQDFRSLLALLDPAFAAMPDDLTGEANRRHREVLARHLVQRRRADLEAFLGVETPFPQRDVAEVTYGLHPEYRLFLEKALAWCKEQVGDPAGARGGDERRRRVRWWSALALLRSISSSPEAAVATLTSRAASLDTDTVEEADAVGRRVVLDQADEGAEGTDVVPGSVTEEGDTGEGDPDAGTGTGTGTTEQRRLRALAAEARKLTGEKDRKLAKATELVRGLLKDGFAPIVFCRFIATAEYVAAALRTEIGKGDKVQVACVTGRSAPEEREAAILALDEERPRVLVCTDCLSEGINLQHVFDAVVHYDLCWNPTRHEQREGRVDRFNQRSERVRALTFYGKDNPVDGIVIEVLVRKHNAIRDLLGVTVPIPLDNDAVVQAILEGLILRGKKEEAEQMRFPFAEGYKAEVDTVWTAAAERHKRSRTIYAQRTIDLAEVQAELDATRRAIGDDKTIERFVRDALPALGGTIADLRPTRPAPVAIDPAGAPLAVRDAIQAERPFKAAFEQRALGRGVTLLTRTHPVVAGLAAHVLETALDPQLEGGPARRSGVVRTRAVAKRTTLLLLRLRFHIVTPARDGAGSGPERKILAEDQMLVGFRGAPGAAEWLDAADLEPLLAAAPDANTSPDVARDQLERVLSRFADLRPALDEAVRRRGDELLEAHRRVRRAARQAVRALRVEPHLPADVLGIFVYLPVSSTQPDDPSVRPDDRSVRPERRARDSGPGVEGPAESKP